MRVWRGFWVFTGLVVCAWFVCVFMCCALLVYVFLMLFRASSSSSVFCFLVPVRDDALTRAQNGDGRGRF